MEDIQQVLLAKNEQAILDLIKNDIYLDRIKDCPWEILPALVRRISNKNEQENSNLYSSLLSALEVITSKINPDDIVLIVIKEIEDVTKDTTFLILLQLLQGALTTLLPRNKINYLAWSLNTVHLYLNEIPEPENFNLDEKEKLLMDADETVARISILYYDILPFYDSLLLMILSLNFKDHKTLLLRNLLQLLGHPLVYLDMDIENKPKSKARLIAEDLVHKIVQLCSDTYIFLEEDFSNDNEDVKIKPLCLSVFYYLHLAENVEILTSPKVYNPIFVFQSTLNCVINLLAVEHQFVLEKGLKLMSTLIQITSSFTLPYQLLDSETHCKFCKSITNIITYNTVESYRKQSLKLFHSYLYKFDARGRYLLIYNMTKCVENISLISYIITQYKQMILEQFDKYVTINYYFKDSKLFALLSEFCHLPENIETDLIKNADQIIASLNLLRYLVLRDKSNATGVWNYLKSIQKTFLEPLKEALILSRAHYNLKLMEISNENMDGDKSEDNNKMSVLIGGKHLAELTPAEKIKVINSSITAFDVIDSLLSRLTECIEYNSYSLK